MTAASTESAVLPAERAGIEMSAPLTRLIGAMFSPRWLAALWLLAGVATLALAAADGADHSFVAVMWAGVLLALGAAAVTRFVGTDRTLAVRLFTGAFLARYSFAAIVVSLMASSEQGRLEGGSDYLHYDSAGWAQAELWRMGDMSWILPYSDAGYFYLIAAVYTVTGHYLMAPTLLSALFGGLAAVVTFLLAKRLYGRRVGIVAGGLAAFIPTLLFWSGLLYKDVIISFLMITAIHVAIRLRERFSASDAIVLGAILGPLFALRTGMAAVVVVLIGIFLLTRTEGLLTKRLPALLLAGAILIFLMNAIQQQGMGGGGVLAGMERAVAMAAVGGGVFSEELATRGGEGLSQALYGRNLLVSPHLLLLGAGFLFVTPVPGTATLGLNFATFLIPGQLVWISLIPALLVGAAFAIRRHRAAELLLVGICGAAIVAIVLGGYVSNPRYLVQVVPPLLIMASLGISRLGATVYLYLGGLAMFGSALVLYLFMR